MTGLLETAIPPIRNRIDMLATRIKRPVQVSVAGAVLTEIDETPKRLKRAAKGVPDVSSAQAERLAGGRYIAVDNDRKSTVTLSFVSSSCGLLRPICSKVSNCSAGIGRA